MKYKVEFHGRQAGAIGIRHNCEVTLESETPLTGKEIVKKVYETHEHIGGCLHVTQGSTKFRVDLEGNTSKDY